MRTHYTLSALSAFLIALSFLSANAHALDFDGGTPKGVTWTLVEQEIQGAPGGTVIVHIAGDIPKGWHTYSLLKYKIGPASTVITVEPKDMASIDVKGVTYDPKPVNDKRSADAFGIPLVESFEHKVTFAVPVKIAAEASGDSLKLTLKVVSTICDVENCLQPTTTLLNPVVSLKKKVGDAEKPLTFKHASLSEIDWALADQHAKISTAAGGQIFLTVEGMIKNGWHTFATKQDPKCKFAAITSFSVEPKELVSIEGDVTSDRPTKGLYDDTLTPPGTVCIFEDKVRFTIPIRVHSSTPMGTMSLKLIVHSQACKEVCKQISRSFDSVVEISAKTAATAETPSKSGDSGIDFSQGLFAFLLSAAAAGAISLLTPCVFPMIPITVSFFTKRNHVSHSKAVRDALIFSLGIILTYVGLAFGLEVAFGKNIRELATNPWMNLAIFGVFLALAISLFGFYELQLPSGLINRLNKSAHGGDSISGLLLMGLVFTLTSFSCTGPFVGTVMLAAVNGSWVWPLLGMTVFATVFAAPFFFLALFPTALKSLPRSGGWLNSVKVVMGFVEVAAALKFLSSADLVWHWGIITHEVFVGIWILLALAAVAYILGVFRFPHDTPVKKLGASRIVFATLFIVAAGLLAGDLAGYPAALGSLASFPPPRPYPPSTTDDWETGMAAARKAGKPVFFDFTGFTCVNCRLMETSMFSRKEVDDILKNYVVVRLYTDAKNSDEEIARSARNVTEQEKRFKVNTLPFYAIVAPDGQVINTFPKGYTDKVDEFTQFLKAGLSSQVTAQN